MQVPVHLRPKSPLQLFQTLGIAHISGFVCCQLRFEFGRAVNLVTISAWYAGVIY